MYKKIFSAILFGALTLASTSTFVSCKDYDDDIENLQGQIDQLANDKVATLETTVSSLQTQLTALDAAYKEGDQQTLAAAKALIEEAIADCQKACKENLAASQAEQNLKYDEAITKVNQRVDDVVKLLSDADGNIQQVGKDLKALSDKLAAFEAKYGALDEAFATLTQRVTNLEDAVKAQKAALEDLAKTIGTNNGSNGYDDTQLKADIDKAGDRISTIEQAVKDLDTKLTKALNDAVTELNGKIGNVATDLETLKGQFTAFQSTTSTEISGIKTRLDAVEGEAKALAAEVQGLDVMLTLLAGDLRSLVFIPILYVDGIETIEYPYLKYALLDETVPYNITRWEQDVITTVNLRNLTDFQDRTLNDSVVYGPVWPVDYHMNPGNADVVWKDILGYYAIEAEVISTRAGSANVNTTYGITSPEKYDNYYNDNDIVWKRANGILTAGIQVKNVDKIEPLFPSGTVESTKSTNNVTVALQVKSTVNDGSPKDTIITSDYAQLLPEKIKIEGLIWNDHPKYWDSENERIKDFWENKKGYGPATALAAGATPAAPTYAHDPAGWDYGYRKGSQNATMGRDTLCPVLKTWCHVWDTPEDALSHPADIELYTSNRSGVKLIEYMGVHYYWDQEAPLTKKVTSHKGVKTWKYNATELQRLGLVWEFDTLDYYVDKNQTHDSRYITINHADGTIIAQNVRESGATYEDETHTAVGREPLVRVRLYHMNNGKDKPILDGYIRVHITKPELLEIATYPAWNVTFDLCNDHETLWTTWAQFSKFVLTDALNNLEKEQFDANYQADIVATSALNSTFVKEMTQFSKPQSHHSENDFYGYKQLDDLAAGVKPTVDDKIGHIVQRYDEVGTTNHIYKWYISAEEMEALTHDQTPWDKEVVIERYIHYTGHFYSSSNPNNAGAPYDDIFIKLTLKIKRSEVPASVTSKRNENYWYNMEGSWAPYWKSEDAEHLQSIAFNTPYPQDGLGNTSRTVPWRTDILSTWDANKVNVTNATGGSKFYLAPFEYEIKALDGTVYIVTPRRGSGDNIYNQFICKYWNEKHAYQLDQTNPFNSSKLEENNAIFQKCAIAYGPSIEGIKANYGMDVASVDDASAWPKADGVFSNDTLYAITKTAYSTAREYEPIAIITNTGTGVGGGQVVLLHEYVENKWLKEDAQPSGNKYTKTSEWDKENAYTEACLNAVGYVTNIVRDENGLMTGEFQDKGNPLKDQLRSYVGVIATSKCNIANQMNDNRTKNFTVFQMPWERPINILQENDFMVDAINNADYIYVVDIIKLFDWRGVNQGHMWGSTPEFWGKTWEPWQWLWAYYNVKSVTLDLRTSKVMTNLSDAGVDGTKDSFKALSSISGKVQLTANGNAGRETFVFSPADANMPLRVSPYDFNSHTENEKLIEYMGLDNPEMEGLDVEKARFGYIKYENNTDNVHDFEVKVPVTIQYDWGEILDQPIKIHIYYTRGNN